MNSPAKLTTTLALLLLPWLFLGMAQAEKVFTWVDEKGVTHYSDRPASGGKNSEMIISVDDPLDEEANRFPEQPSEEPPQEQTPAQPPEGVTSTEPDEATIAFCNKLKANMDALQAEERVRLTHSDGRVEILDDKGKEREKERLRDLMTQFCK